MSLGLDLKQLQEQLDKATNPQTIKPDNGLSLINEAYMQIGKGDIFHNMISCQKLIVEDIPYYFLIAYDKGCPPLTLDYKQSCGEYSYGKWQKVERGYYDMVKEAIQERGNYKYLDNYTFMVAYVLGKFGVDVQDLYVMQEKGAE